jgi:hypothetical protein
MTAKLKAITRDSPVLLSLGLHLSMLAAVFYAGTQLQKLTAIVEKQWTVQMEETSWNRFEALNLRTYPDLRTPDAAEIKRNHAGTAVIIPYRIAENN